MDVATAPAKKYIAMQSQEGKSPYTVAIKLLKGGVLVKFWPYNISLMVVFQHIKMLIIQNEYCTYVIRTHTQKLLNIFCLCWL